MIDDTPQPNIPSPEINIITAEINDAIMFGLLEYQKKGKVSNSDMYHALNEIAESFKRKDIMERFKPQKM